MQNSLASLSPEERRRFIESLTLEERAVLAYYWPAWALPSQLPPPGAWIFWLLLGGRGGGKTRSGSEWIRGKVAEGAQRIALVGPTAADVRDVMVLGESGIIAISPPWDRPLYEPSKRRLVWPNGAQAFLYSAEEPDRLRGPQHDAAWADELCAWGNKQREVFDMLAFGMRLGSNPQTFISTTPRPQQLLRELLKMPQCVVTHSSTAENAHNLAPAFMDEVTRRYGGTRLGRQELEGQLLDDIEGAMWSRSMLEQAQTRLVPSGFKRIIVGLDPSGGGGSAQGIVVAGLGNDGLYYVIEDASCQLSPEQWAARAVSAYERHKADKLVLEKNFGGDMGLAVLQQARRGLPVKMVSASRGKHVRAEPVALLYEQGRIKHLGVFPELEDQMCAMRADGYAGEGSPDRLDALVWAITELSGPPNVAYIVGGGLPMQQLGGSDGFKIR